jgi:hypothetical protein
LLLVTNSATVPDTVVVPPPPDADEIALRLDRIKRLTDQLESAQSDQLKFRELIERIRAEADEFRRTLATHDGVPRSMWFNR